MRLTIILLLLSFTTVNAQHEHENHEGEHHNHHKNEIGVANSPVYFVKEKELSYSLHLHYVYNISETKFGLGLGYERIFDEHKHSTIGIVGSYRPFEGLSFNLSPGITFEADSELNFALHVETAYEWELGNFHVGPVFEIAYDPEDYHISLGLHIGYGF